MKANWLSFKTLDAFFSQKFLLFRLNFLHFFNVQNLSLKLPQRKQRARRLVFSLNFPFSLIISWTHCSHLQDFSSHHLVSRCLWCRLDSIIVNFYHFYYRLESFYYQFPSKFKGTRPHYFKNGREQWKALFCVVLRRSSEVIKKFYDREHENIFLLKFFPRD